MVLATSQKSDNIDDICHFPTKPSRSWLPKRRRNLAGNELPRAELALLDAPSARRLGSTMSGCQSSMIFYWTLLPWCYVHCHHVHSLSQGRTGNYLHNRIITCAKCRTEPLPSVANCRQLAWGKHRWACMASTRWNATSNTQVFLSITEFTAWRDPSFALSWGCREWGQPICHFLSFLGTCAPTAALPNTISIQHRAYCKNAKGTFSLRLATACPALLS